MWYPYCSAKEQQQKKIIWHGDSNTKPAFETLKHLIEAAPVFQYFDSKKRLK